jgi:hypothetical protein
MVVDQMKRSLVVGFEYLFSYDASIAASELVIRNEFHMGKRKDLYA